MDVQQPTDAQYAAYAAAYAHFNAALFGGALPQPMLVFSPRPMVNGSFRPRGWRPRGGEDLLVDEISLNPEYLAQRQPIEIAATLVHEMCHQLQYLNGRPSRPGYHNAEFASIMAGVGLQTTSDGTPEGRRVGQRMTHLVIDDGAFARAFAALDGGELFLPFVLSTPPPPGTKGRGTKGRRPDRSKIKYETLGQQGPKPFWAAPGVTAVDVRSGQLYLRTDDPEATLECLDVELVALIGDLVTASPACRARVRAVLTEG